ncbi:MAG TPA: hypothetical protein VE870_12845 [Bacteroidales bacterium]|nr:hypothetical protein [Bacteroidales bacterium]
MQKSGKITVKHYLNKRGKPKQWNGQDFYPLYLQIMVAGQKAQLRSKIQDYLFSYRGYIDQLFDNKALAALVNRLYLSEDLFRDIRTKKIFPLSNILSDEIHLVSSIIDTCKPFKNEDFSLTNFGQHIDCYLKDVYTVLDFSVKQNYLDELTRIFNETSNCEDDRKLFKLTNYFIHFINWDNIFCDFYEMTYEMLPSEIKYIENHLSEDLKVQIKALMAFHARENFLRRYLDKKEKGRFPTVNYIDWLDEGREFISKEFIKIFGRQKAMDYITTLDAILSRRLEPSLIM